MAKLEWVPTGSGRWACGLHRIHVRADGMFVAHYGESRAECCETLSEAQDWCQQQEDAAQSQTPMPKAGEVWGDPGYPQTWSMVRDTSKDYCVDWSSFQRSSSDSMSQWQEWLRTSEAVNITALLQEAEQTRAKLAKAVEGLKAIHGYAHPERNFYASRGLAGAVLEQIGEVGNLANRP